MNGACAGRFRGSVAALGCAAAAVFGAALPACASEEGPARVGVAVALPFRAAVAAETLQVAAIADPQSHDCATLTETCVKDCCADLVETSVSAPFDELAAADAGQVLVLEGLPVGRRYLVVVEAIGAGFDGDEIVASGCAITEEVSEGENAEVTVLVVERTPATSCDARL